MVTQHAIARYRERACGDKMSSGKIANILRNIVISGKEVAISDPVKAMRQLLSHDVKPARYYRLNGLIAVVEDRAIVTVHTGNAGKWTEKNEKAIHS